MLEKAKLIICTIVKAATLCAAPEMQSSNGRQPFHTSALDRFRNCDQTSQCSRVNLYDQIRFGPCEAIHNMEFICKTNVQSANVNESKHPVHGGHQPRGDNCGRVSNPHPIEGF
jgi:hypothetical protein